LVLVLVLVLVPLLVLPVACQCPRLTALHAPAMLCWHNPTETDADADAYLFVLSYLFKSIP
jgi:hypothetical protein